MPKNLSRATSSPVIEHFYTPIHARMSELERSGSQRPTLVEFTRTLEKLPIQAGGIALDAGCGGTADISIACVQRGFGTVCGIDLNEESLRLARRLLAARHLDGVRLSRGSILNLPFADECFDFVACLGVAHHTVSPEQAISEIARVLKPGGAAYISVYCFADSAFESVLRMMRWIGTRIPFGKLHGLLGRSRAWNNFVMDHMYVPILWVFRAEEVRRLFDRLGLGVLAEWPSSMDPFCRFGKLGQYITTDGLMRVWLCEKRS
jgi:ubiquinone/menaquinone biosynthesis C-methylase UbiE